MKQETEKIIEKVDDVKPENKEDEDECDSDSDHGIVNRPHRSRSRIGQDCSHNVRYDPFSFYQNNHLVFYFFDSNTSAKEILCIVESMVVKYNFGFFSTLVILR